VNLLVDRGVAKGGGLRGLWTPGGTFWEGVTLMIKN